MAPFSLLVILGHHLRLGLLPVGPFPDDAAVVGSWLSEVIGHLIP